MSSDLVPTGIDTVVQVEDDAAGPSLFVSVSITDTDGTSWSATGHVEPPISDDDLAELILNTATGAAAMRGSGVWMALQRRLAEEPS